MDEICCESHGCGLRVRLWFSYETGSQHDRVSKDQLEFKSIFWRLRGWFSRRFPGGRQEISTSPPSLALQADGRTTYSDTVPHHPILTYVTISSKAIVDSLRARPCTTATTVYGMTSASGLLLLPDEPFLQECNLGRDVALHGFARIRVEMAARK